MGRITDSLRHALFNAFGESSDVYRGLPQGSSVGSSFGGSRPHVAHYRMANERSIVASILATMSVDVSDIELRHALIDEDGGYVSTVNDGLHYCLTTEANIDQAARAFRRDVAMMVLDKGAAAIVPVDTIGDPFVGDDYQIKTMRVGEIVQWYARYVRVRLYDDRDGPNIAGGQFKEVVVPKRSTAIIENPFYSIMNEPNSTLQRLVRKLALLDVTDENNSSGKLDMVIQLPYAVRTDTRRKEAEQRRNDIEFQLAGGKYGIAYIDGTEKVTQLNRPIENKLLEEVTYLTAQVFSQLGMTEEIMNGTAEEATMINYMARRVEPIADAFAEEIHRKFLSRTARSQKHAILYFRNPFKLIPITRLAEVSDVLSRNEITAPNELRKAIGLPPSKDPKANELNNSNMPAKAIESGDANTPPPRFVSSQMAADDAQKALNKKMPELEAR